MAETAPRRPGEIALKTARPALAPPDAGGDGASLPADPAEGVMLALPVVEKPRAANRPGARPDWLRVKLPYGETFRSVQETIERYDLHTVCASARCPNMGECWTAGTATFMVLGDVCTRSCSFCAVHTGRPEAYDLDWDEPRRVAEAARLMGLRHVVVTSINRDDREDGGAPIFAETIRLVREQIPGCTIEVLIPDMRGLRPALETVFDARPDVLNHNVETVPRLYRRVRPQADYQRSLDVLKMAKDEFGLRVKSGIMVGLGETEDEVHALMDDFAAHGVDVMTIGQYLQPTKMHLPVERFVHPDEFARYKAVGEAKGIEHVESGPLVRSSYHAERHVG
ncbi:MAG: lipoyl synthase [Rubricoccaceae bacterium]|nr:lipoyl synthase [Rubricoccaceae bacterium]